MTKIEELIQEIELAKAICPGLGIIWDEIKTDYEPKIMLYDAFGLA